MASDIGKGLGYSPLSPKDVCVRCKICLFHNCWLGSRAFLHCHLHKHTLPLAFISWNVASRRLSCLNLMSFCLAASCFLSKLTEPFPHRIY